MTLLKLLPTSFKVVSVLALAPFRPSSLVVRNVSGLPLGVLWPSRPSMRAYLQSRWRGPWGGGAGRVKLFVSVGLA